MNDNFFITGKVPCQELVSCPGDEFIIYPSNFVICEDNIAKFNSLIFYPAIPIDKKQTYTFDCFDFGFISDFKFYYDAILFVKDQNQSRYYLRNMGILKDVSDEDLDDFIGNVDLINLVLNTYELSKEELLHYAGSLTVMANAIRQGCSITNIFN